LVETYRNAEGKVRQQALLNLGNHFDVPKEQWKLLADRIEEIRQGQQSLLALDTSLEKESQRIAKLLIQKFSRNESSGSSSLKKNSPPPVSDYQTVDVNSLEHQQIRKIGAEHVGYSAAKQLNLEQVLAQSGFNPKQIKVALGSIIGRLVHPGSELNTHRYLTEHSALDELLETDFSNLPLKLLYQISDSLLKYKTVIEEALYCREKDLFQLEEVVTLYDLTNTYFEGKAAGHPKAKRGRSKEKRSDCRLITLGMVLDSSGFPKRSEVFAGNVSEPSTLQKMLEKLTGQNKPTLVMDAGIATKENLKWLNESSYQYIVVSRGKNLTMPEGKEKVLVKESASNTVQVALVKNEMTNEFELYCHSTAKEAKSTQMVSQAMARYEMELKKLAEGLHKKRGTKECKKVLGRLGRLKEKYKKVGYLYEVTVTTDEQKEKVIDLVWTKCEEAIQEKQRGIYCLKTNRTDLDANTFWKIYTMLTDLESAFRSLKSELGLRPIYHQKENRIDGHLFISVLAYHLLHVIRYQLKGQGIHANWQTLRELLSTQCRITTTARLKNGKVLQIRKTSSPDVNQSEIYKALNIATHPGKTEKVYF
jgi:transposase